MNTIEKLRACLDLLELEESMRPNSPDPTLQRALNVIVDGDRNLTEAKDRIAKLEDCLRSLLAAAKTSHQSENEWRKRAGMLELLEPAEFVSVRRLLP